MTDPEEKVKYSTSLETVSVPSEPFKSVTVYPENELFLPSYRAVNLKLL